MTKNECPKPASNYCTLMLSDEMYFILLFATCIAFCFIRNALHSYMHWW